MEKKEGIKINFSALLLTLAVIAIIVMGYFIYNLYNSNIAATKEITTLNYKICDQQNTIDSLQETINSASNTLNSTNLEKSNNSDNQYKEITEELQGIDVLYVTNVEDNNDSYTLKGVIYTQYTLSKAELNKILNSGFMNFDNKTYTIKRSNEYETYDLYDKQYEFPVYKIKQSNSTSYYLESQSQLADVWKLTDEYRKITISKDTPAEMNFDMDELYKTAEDVFKDFKSSSPENTSNPNDNNTFIFEFDNGKCTKVISELTSMSM